ncbi:septum formation protein [Methanohalophilus levihalophilus]|uniref:Maf family nucleotide pyrophosphatase n=1 Tax=Methanohalophilus levihalophilus TaxID=1431282 RepID=UPI001AE25A92|nr:Maf family nucleotide pyrophosphatase [Methanohalophilus levihalophilus]MBP2030971.1 septum formation protein [Methanohalophilus levihalophilus]
MKHIILASGSPRRKELLSQLIGDSFEVIVSSYEEPEIEDTDHESVVLHHAVRKGYDVAGKLDDGVVISADTMVLCKGKLIGKPYSDLQAYQILESISGQEVHVITGLFLIDVTAGKEFRDTVSTVVSIRKLSNDEIASYVASGEPLGKAGAFAIQGKGAAIVERIEGDYFNVVGLPLFSLSRMLKQIGITVLAPHPLD